MPPRATVATFNLLLFFPPWEGDGALLPRSTMALFDPLLLLLLPWAGGGDGRLHPRATLTTLDLAQLKSEIP